MKLKNLKKDTWQLIRNFKSCHESQIFTLADMARILGITKETAENALNKEAGVQPENGHFTKFSIMRWVNKHPNFTSSKYYSQTTWS
jgi:hypothetical protein